MNSNPNTPIPVQSLPVRSLQLAVLGRDILSTYTSKMMDMANRHNDLEAYLYYRNLADLIADMTTGLILGSLLYESRLIIDNPVPIPLTPSLSQALNFYKEDTHILNVPS